MSDDKERLHNAVQQAAELLPLWWNIRIEIEKDAGSVTLEDPNGDDVEYASNHESLAESVEDALQHAIENAAAYVDEKEQG